MPDWFAMRRFSAGGCAGTRILGEVFPNLDQDNNESELEDLLSLGFRDDDSWHYKQHKVLSQCVAMLSN